MRAPFAPQELALLAAGVEELEPSDQQQASYLRQVIAGLYGSEAQHRAPAKLAQLLLGSRWLVEPLRGVFPEPCSVCRREIHSPAPIAISRASSRSAHPDCVKVKPEVVRVADPAEAMQWLAQRFDG